ncbi:MAG: DUF229 domain-containing protein [Methylocystaceae bacterium]|nr:DUF229 domain-containing protein [Methylocystaceae bacterium]
MSNQSVLFIVVDQWRADYVPHVMRAAGREPFLDTPNLDRLCRRGVTFKNHVTTAVPCGPARASLLTGLYQMNHRAVQNTIPLDRRHLTLATALRDLGYDAALVGYTTTVPDPRTTSPNDPAFQSLGDLMQGWRNVGAFEPNMDAYFGWVAQKGFPIGSNRSDIWLPEGDGSIPGVTNRPSRIPKELSDSAFFTERALTYMKGRGGRPFFLHMGYYRPHPPFVAPAPYHNMFDANAMPQPVRASNWEQEAKQHPLLDFYLRQTRQASFFESASGHGHELSEADILQLRATYCGMIREVDDNIGRLLDYLEETDQLDNTLIVFTSDHGEQLGDHYLLGKIGYFDESFRVPLVICDPRNKGRNGEVEKALTESIDLMPTLIDWLGGEVPQVCDGRSLTCFLSTGAPADWRTELHYEYDFRDIFYSQPQQHLGLSASESSLCVVQDENYKYVHFAALPPLFFDLQADPGQFFNLANDISYAPHVREYAQKALSWRLKHADRSLTHYRSSPQGLLTRNEQGAPTSLRTRPVIK